MEMDYLYQECTTPKNEECRIPEITECPPAPRKKMDPPMRKLNKNAPNKAYFQSPELDTFFAKVPVREASCAT
ncbi:hypothetical protein LIER_18758 [Lithospermum erythrorhizon]|uniref:Uncharacterized protein n=1 Tax=Lithospermum erythrorhizon TaxID=34254 RepID=A0AAV3QGE7_LITER